MEELTQEEINALPINKLSGLPESLTVARAQLAKVKSRLLPIFGSKEYQTLQGKIEEILAVRNSGRGHGYVSKGCSKVADQILTLLESSNDKVQSNNQMP